MRDIELKFTVKELSIMLSFINKSFSIENDVEYQLFARFERAYDKLRKCENK